MAAAAAVLAISLVAWGASMRLVIRRPAQAASP